MTPSTPPHTHNGAAVFAQVVKGSVISQMIHQHTVAHPDGSTEVQNRDSGMDAVLLAANDASLTV
jgi:hypothetical protein